MTKYKDNEVIDLYWDGPPDDLVVKGHMPPAEAAQILFDHGHDIYEPWQDPCPMYGRWSMEPGQDGNGQVLREYKDPGRGRFKIMVADIYNPGEPPGPGPLLAALLKKHNLKGEWETP